MQKLFISILVIIITCLLLPACAPTNKQGVAPTGITAKWIDKNLEDAVTQYKYFMTKIPEGVMPRSFTKDTLRTCTSENWTAGFYPGTLLYLYESIKDEVLFTETLKKIKLMEKVFIQCFH